MSARRSGLALWSAACALALLPEGASALPRYAAAYGQECGLCHHDPTGGGLRTTYATQYLIPVELAWTNAYADRLEALDPTLGEHLVVGADLRLLWNEPEQDTSTLLVMQSDVHVVLQMDERTSVSVDVGSGRRSEAFGLLRVLPWTGWMKAGRFVGAYGWRFSDHQTFVRRHLLSTAGEPSPVAWEDSGVELGLAPGRLQWTASLQAGEGDAGESWTTRVVARQGLGSWNFSAGASALRRQRADGHRRGAGVFASLGNDRITWVGQGDRVHASDGRTESILTQELAFTVARGWSVILTHDFHDPDRELASGARQRYGVGLDVLFTPFVGLNARIRNDDPDRGPAVDEASRWTADTVLHFLF